MIIGANDSDRADTPDEWTLGEISVTACMILLWVWQKQDGQQKHKDKDKYKEKRLTGQ